MFSHRLNPQTPSRVAFNWLLLCFNSGFINAGGFLLTGRFVTHVTGFGTLFGVEMVKQQWLDALGILSVPVFFICGSFVAGWLIDRRVYRGKRPHYDWVMALSCLALILAGLAGSHRQWDIPLEAAEVGKVYAVLAALCLASGLQNGALTTASGHSVRVTHLTGITTDLGLGFARMLSLGRGNEKLRLERRANAYRAATIIAFILGSVLGALFFLRLHSNGFVVPALIAAYAAVQGRRDKLTEASSLKA